MKIFTNILKIVGLLVLIWLALAGRTFYSAVKEAKQPKYYEENGRMYYDLRLASNNSKDAPDFLLKTEIKGSDPDTFKVISGKYSFSRGSVSDILSVDKDSVFIQESEGEPVVKLIDADPKTIKQVDGVWWLQDKNNVYLGGNKVDGADPASFSEIKNPLYKDKNNIYVNNNVLLGADVENFAETFEVLNYPYYRDSSNVYYCDLTDSSLPTCTVVSGADQSTFVVQNLEDAKSELGDKFAFDKNHVYYLGNIIEGADPKTFKKNVINQDEFYQDANHTYKYASEEGDKIIMYR